MASGCVVEARCLGNSRRRAEVGNVSGTARDALQSRRLFSFEAH